MEGNQGELLQIKPNGATSMLGDLATRRTRVQDGQPYERKRSYGRSYEVPGLPLIYRRHFREGNNTHWRNLAAATPF